MRNFEIFRSTTDRNDSFRATMMRALRENGELSVKSLRALSPLSDKAQVMVDKAVVEVGVERLSLVADIIAAGLTYPLTDPLSVTQLEWEVVSKQGGAQRTMTPSARGENQKPKRVVHRLPIYLTTDDFSLDVRTLKASQRVGTPLDVSGIQQATRRVNEALEDAAIYGATTLDGEDLNVGGYDAPGLLNAPNANTHTITTAWNNASELAGFTIGAKIFADVETMIGKLQADRKYGPYHLFVSTLYGNALDHDYKSGTNGTIRARLMEIQSIRKITVVDQMPTHKVGLVQMTNDVVDIVDGQSPTVVPWMSPDGFELNWVVLAIQVPRFRSDYDGNSGVCIGTHTP